MNWSEVLLYLLALNLIAWAVVTRQLIVLRRDRDRLDWLQTTMGPEVENQGYGNPHGEHVANSWYVRWPCHDVRQAIDKNRGV